MRYSVLAVVLAIGAGSRANTLTVTNAGDKGAGSLRDSVGHAKSGDRIVFDSSLAGQTIALTSGEIVIKNNVDIEGPGAGLVAVSGGDASRVFLLGEGLIVTISGLTLTHGRAGGNNGGGGILNVGSALTLADDVLSYNQSTGPMDDFAVGGGIANIRGAVLSVTRTAFLENQALAKDASYGGLGGAIFNSSSTATVTRCTFTGNRAVGGSGGKINGVNGDLNIGQGGAIISKGSSSTLVIKDSAFTGNQAIGGDGGNGGPGTPIYFVGIAVGGAVSNHDASTLILSGSTFAFNEAIGGSNSTGGTSGIGYVGAALGGGLFNMGVATVANCTFDSNSAFGGSSNSAGSAFIEVGVGIGGGIFSITGNGGLATGAGALTADNLVLTNNQAIGGAGNVGGPFPGAGIGGGLGNLRGATATVISTTFSGNQAIGGAGGAGASSAADGLGGAIANHTGATLTLKDNCALDGNQAIGGAGASGGNGRGGGIWNDGPSLDPANTGTPATAAIFLSTITGNQSIGGSGSSGSDGLGEGGGLYLTPGGAACKDASSTIDDIVGVLSGC